MALEQHDIRLDMLDSPIKSSWTATIEADYAACRAVMRAASRNYSFAARFLPAAKLPHIEALYAVMRLGDDLVDVHYKGAEATAAIEDYKRQYWRAFERGDSHSPVLRAYLHTAQTYEISPDLLAPYFQAMIEDLTITRFPTFADLVAYMDGSAIPVGRIMVHILGTHTAHVSDMYPEADSLAIAMQLSNFWRDIGQDWGLGRIYIPQEDMERFRYSESDLANHRINPNFIELLDFEIERTERYYTHARTGISRLASGQNGVMGALNIYRAILFSIRRNRYNVFTIRAGTSYLQKLALVASAFWQTL